MEQTTIEREVKNSRDEALKFAAPFQTLWKLTFFDLPLSVASETLRFMGRRLQAQGDHLANLNACRTVPEIIDLQSHFVRAAVDDYGNESSKIMEDVRGTMSEVRQHVGKAA